MVAEMFTGSDFQTSTEMTYYTSNQNYSNKTVIGPLPLYGLVPLAVFLGSVVVGTIVGNLLVVLSIARERDLRKPQNYLIFSLAIADLLVGVLVLPVATAKELMNNFWVLGTIICDLWTSLDVLICTASILHLVAIALDRYWSITDVVYSQQRTQKKILMMIGVIWLVAIVTSVGPLIGWKDDGFHERIANGECLLSQEVSYQIYATVTAFYVPLFLIIVLYWKIYIAAKERLGRQKQNRNRSNEVLSRCAVESQAINSRMPVVCNLHVVDASQDYVSGVYDDDFEVSEMVTTHAAVSARLSSPNLNNGVSKLGERRNGSLREVIESRRSSRTSLSPHDAVSMLKSSPQVDAAKIRQPRSSTPARLNISPKTSMGLRKRLRKSSNGDMKREKRERRAFTTLAIVTGTFLVCWLPFFVLALVRPLCEVCSWPDEIDSCVVWLGYINSLMNPIIYTIFSPDFRAAFKKILSRALVCLGDR